MTTTRRDAMNDALERLTGLGFEMRPGFSAHGPMGAETYCTLGDPDGVGRWVEKYKERHLHFEVPPTKDRLDGSSERDWRTALGDMARISDWAVWFRRELEGRPWQDVLTTWLDRLLPGYAGGLTHGLIRTSHAVRTIGDDPDPSRLMLDELANGLAYWAARYTPIPGRVHLTGSLTLRDALDALPHHVPEGRQSLRESGSFVHLNDLAGFDEALEGLGPPADEDAAFSDLTSTFCRVLIAHDELAPVPFVHLVTPTAAIRILLPYLPHRSVADLYAQIWQVNAAIIAAFSRERRQLIDLPEAVDDLPTPAELLARAVEHRDTHVMKFTRACVSEFELRPDPAYLLAAETLRKRMPAW